jgi:hypothetical protein
VRQILTDLLFLASLAFAAPRDPVPSGRALGLPDGSPELQAAAGDLEPLLSEELPEVGARMNPRSCVRFGWVNEP